MPNDIDERVERIVGRLANEHVGDPLASPRRHSASKALERNAFIARITPIIRDAVRLADAAEEVRQELWNYADAGCSNIAELLHYDLAERLAAWRRHEA